MNTTIRNLICEEIVKKFSSESLAAISLPQRHRYITREPMCQGMIDTLRGGESALSIIEGQESNINKQYTTTTKRLVITIELYYKARDSELDWKTRAQSFRLNQLLGEIQLAMLNDPQCNNLALNIYEESNTLDIDGIYDNTVGIEATFLVEYRHLTKDPTKRV